MKPVALVDLDGTLADFDGAMMRDLAAMMAPGELDVRDIHDDVKYPYLKARRNAIKLQPDWWFNLAPIPQGFRVVEMLRKLDFKIHVCTRGPKNNSIAWEQKVRWVRQHLPDASITITLDKSLMYGRVLVDDWPSYVKPWLKARPRGTVIMPERRWNTGYTHAQIIRHTDNDEEVYEALKAQRSRK
jgi:5'-nucleotidase